MDTEMEDMLHLKVLHSPHAHARIVSIDTSAALEVSRRAPCVHLGGRSAEALQHSDPYRPPGGSRRHLHTRQRRAVRGPAGGGRRRRLRRCRRGGLPQGRSGIRTVAGGLRSRRGDGRRRTAVAQLRRPLRPRQGAQHPARTARRGRRRRRPVSPKPMWSTKARTSRRASSTPTSRPTVRSPGWKTTGYTCGPVRSRRRREAQALPLVRSSTRPAPGVLQEGRRRLRRQAGGHLRGPGRAGDSGHRPARLLGVHPRGGVHHGLTAASDEDHRETRRQIRRHADSGALPQRVQHRRIR